MQNRDVEVLGLETNSKLTVGQRNLDTLRSDTSFEIGDGVVNENLERSLGCPAPSTGTSAIIDFIP